MVAALLCICVCNSYDVAVVMVSGRGIAAGQQLFALLQ